MVCCNRNPIIWCTYIGRNILRDSCADAIIYLDINGIVKKGWDYFNCIPAWTHSKNVVWSMKYPPLSGHRINNQISNQLICLIIDGEPQLHKRVLQAIYTFLLVGSQSHKSPKVSGRLGVKMNQDPNTWDAPSLALTRHIDALLNHLLLDRCPGKKRS